jgi:hypothetical protein
MRIAAWCILVRAMVSPCPDDDELTQLVERGLPEPRRAEIEGLPRRGTTLGRYVILEVRVGDPQVLDRIDPRGLLDLRASNRCA